MKYGFSKITMHNFKLFTHAEIDFENKKLMVLDGPNGYGKTSTFDAIEYLITGTIERIAGNKISTGNISYENDCIMKSPSDGTDTYVEGILIEETGEEIKITRILVKAENNKENKPNQIKARTKTTIEFQGEIMEFEEVDAANQWIQNMIGNQVISFYNRFYYISQEDRLAFLRESDTDRMKEIKKLFGIEKEDEMLKKLGAAKSSFKNLKESLETSIRAKKEDIEKIILPEEDEKKETYDYKKILDESITTVVWDNKNFPNIDKNQLLEFESEVRKTGFFSRDFTIFQKDLKNQWIETKSENKQQLGEFLLLESYQPEIQNFKSEKDVYKKIEKVANDIENQSIDYEKVNYEDLALNLQLQINIEDIQNIRNEIQKCRQCVKDEDNMRSELKRMQEGMEKVRNEWILKEAEGLKESQCPFCGKIWDSPEKLETGIKALKDIIEKGKGEEQKKLDTEIEKLQKIFIENCQQPVLAYVSSHLFLASDICNNLYSKWEEIKPKYIIFKKECKNYNINLTDWQLPKDRQDVWNTTIANFILNVLKANITEVSDEYLVRKHQYEYDNIYSNIFSSDEKKVHVLAESEINEKISYMEQQFYLNQGKLLDTLKEEKLIYENKSKQANEIFLKVKEMEDLLKKELNIYKKNIVRKIRLPFFIYTGRILQNYPGGLGIKMTIAGDEKIRFEASDRKEHDAFYTLSSGQLSAVAIALALTLNKIYAPDSFQCIMIDDPIQTMDELNISSFVEMLRNDFSEYQFIISTHEDNFSDYVRYKYEKYNLPNKYITIQGIDND